MKKMKYKITYWRNLERRDVIIEAHNRIEAVAKLRDIVGRNIHVTQVKERTGGENIQIQE